MATYQEEKKQYLLDFIREYQDHLYRLAYCYKKNPEDAMDLTQDAVIKAITKIDTLRERDNIKNWVYRILVNECLMFLRKNKRLLYLEDSIGEIEDERQKIGEDRIDLLRALEHLNPKQRTVIMLHYFEDMKLDEIAAVTETNLSTVKSRLYKGLELMKKWL